MFYALGAFVLFFLLMWRLQKYASKERARFEEATRRVMHPLGFRPAGPPASLPGGPQDTLQDADVSDCFRNAYDGRLLFNQLWHADTRSSQNVLTGQTVAAFDCEDQPLPVLRVVPKTLGDMLKEWAGHEAISFAENPAFDGAYAVHGKDAGRIRAMFPPALQQAFLDVNQPGRSGLPPVLRQAGRYASSFIGDWLMESDGRWLFIYRFRCRYGPENLAAFVATTAALAEVVRTGTLSTQAAAEIARERTAIEPPSPAGKVIEGCGTFLIGLFLAIMLIVALVALLAWWMARHGGRLPWQ